jgi:hypothetical protein
MFNPAGLLTCFERETQGAPAALGDPGLRCLTPLAFKIGRFPVTARDQIGVGSTLLLEPLFDGLKQQRS